MFKPQLLELINIGSHAKTKYEIQQGKVTVVVGRNLDDEGQEGNGSGKSYLGEGYALALLGEPIRKIRMKELIRNGQSQGSVRLILHNAFLKQTITIARNFYIRGSSECFLWVNDVEQNHKADINDKNKWILEQLGIIASDIYDFFLITKDHYEPFFSLTDKKMKEIVNRFSRANYIDQVELPIKRDIQEKEEDLKILRDTLIKNETTKEVLVEQIEESRDAFLRDQSQRVDLLSKKKIQKQQQIAEKDVELKEFDGKESLLNDELKETKNSIIDSEVVIKANEERIVEVEGEINSKERELDKKRKREEEREAAFLKEKEDFREKENDISSTINELLIREADFEKQLIGIIQCPDCNKEFSIQDKHIDINRLRRESKKNKIDIAKYNISLDEIRNELRILLADSKKEAVKIGEEMSKLKLDIKSSILIKKNAERLRNDNNEAVLELKEQVLNITHSIKNLTLDKKKIEHQIILLQQEVEDIQEEIETIKKEEFDEEKNIERLSTLDKVREELMKDSNRKEIERAKIEEWLINFKNFKTYLANKSIKNIEDYTNLFLQQIESNIRIQIDGYKTTSTNKLKEEINVSVLRDGFNAGSYGKFSGGEKGRLDICCILAIRELINLNTGGRGLDLLLCDEIIDSIDSYGLECIVRGLGNTGKTIQLISQHMLVSLLDQTVLVQKKDKVSKIISVKAVAV